MAFGTPSSSFGGATFVERCRDHTEDGCLSTRRLRTRKLGDGRFRTRLLGSINTEDSSVRKRLICLGGSTMIES
jgi:hypothetical protein